MEEKDVLNFIQIKSQEFIGKNKMKISDELGKQFDTLCDKIHELGEGNMIYSLSIIKIYLNSILSLERNTMEHISDIINAEMGEGDKPLCH